MITSVKNIEDIKIFSRELIAEGCNFHPDDDFHGYVSIQTGDPTYTFKEAELRNNLMNQCFEVCAACNEDIYDITMEVFLLETGLSEFIPLPSQSPE